MPGINIQTSGRLWEQDFRALLHEHSISIRYEISIVHNNNNNKLLEPFVRQSEGIREGKLLLLSLSVSFMSLNSEQSKDYSTNTPL